MFERDRRTYMGYTIGRSLFSNRWTVRRGQAQIACAPSAFAAVELVDDIIDAQVKERVLEGDMTALTLFDRPGRDEAIMGKNPSPATIAENIARAQLALARDLPGMAAERPTKARNAPAQPAEPAAEAQSNDARNT
jgi:hypothetical protein